LVNEPKVWFITGCSSGFGRLLTERLLILGHFVSATARDIASLESLKGNNLLLQTLDVTSSANCQNVIDETLSRFGKIDVVVNNAGVLIAGAIEETPIPEVRKIFDVNFYGVLNILHASLPILRKQRSGHIINISSIAGIQAFPGTGIYSATKFALEAVTESLSQEVADLGIKCTLVEPGAFRTSILGKNFSTPGMRLTDYKTIVDDTITHLESSDGKQPGDPHKAVEAIIDLLDVKNPPLRLLLGEDAWIHAQSKFENLKKEFHETELVTRNTGY
jgi:NADP-dependent 3-hydroxy acid dehydrogenase YdfG